MATDSEFVPPCEEYTEFKDFLTSLRKSDDNIIFTINKTDGSPEQCKEVWNKVLDMYRFRHKHINRCIEELEQSLKKHPESKHLAKQLSFMKSEDSIEQILRSQAQVYFKSKCHGFRPQFPKDFDKTK